MLALAAVCGAAPAAHAAKIVHDRDSGVLSYTAAPGEVNELTVSYDAVRREHSVVDTGVADVAFAVSGARSGCRAAAGGAICAGVRVTAIDIALDDLADSVSADSDLPLTVRGGSGDDAIQTSRGNDLLDGGSGADRLVCGPGSDTVVPDPADVLDPSCGAGGRRADPAPGTEPGAAPDGGAEAAAPAAGGGTPGTGAAPDIVLPVRPVTFERPGFATVAVGCSAEAASGCSGDIYIEVPARHVARRGGVRAARGRHRARQRRIGHRRFRLEPGKTARARVALARGRFVLRNRRKRVRGRVVVVQRDADGKVLGVSTRPVVLERKWSRRKSRRRRR